jgi:hypothetical protein
MYFELTKQQKYIYVALLQFSNNQPTNTNIFNHYLALLQPKKKKYMSFGSSQFLGG